MKFTRLLERAEKFCFLEGTAQLVILIFYSNDYSWLILLDKLVEPELFFHYCKLPNNHTSVTFLKAKNCNTYHYPNAHYSISRSGCCRDSWTDWLMVCITTKHPLLLSSLLHLSFWNKRTKSSVSFSDYILNYIMAFQ